MKYHFYLGLLFLALACEKTDPRPNSLDPVPIDTSYGYPPRVLNNCLGNDTIKSVYPEIPNWRKTLVSNELTFIGFGIPYFIDEVNGFFFRSDGTISKTTDAGISWIVVHKLPVAYFVKCEFSSANHGIVAYNDNPSNTRGVFLVTYDGGNTWAKSTNSAIDIHSINKMQFLSPDLGYVLGYFNSSGYLQKTTDSAKTWTSELSGATQWYPTTFFFQNRDTGYYGNNSNLLYRSIGSDQPWAFTELPSKGITDIRFFDNSFGAVFGNTGVSVTQTGGARWGYVSKRPTYFGRFFSDGSAVLFQKIKTCQTTAVDCFAFVTTEDYGATWTVGPLTTLSNTGYQFCFVNEFCVIGIGGDGKLYKWTRQ